MNTNKVIILNNQNNNYNLNHLYDSIQQFFPLLNKDQKFDLLADATVKNIELLDQINKDNNIVFISTILERSRNFLEKISCDNTHVIAKEGKNTQYGIIFKIRYSSDKRIIELKTYFYFKVLNRMKKVG